MVKKGQKIDNEQKRRKRAREIKRGIRPYKSIETIKNSTNSRQTGKIHWPGKRTLKKGECTQRHIILNVLLFFALIFIAVHSTNTHIYVHTNRAVAFWSLQNKAFMKSNFVYEKVQKWCCCGSHIGSTAPTLQQHAREA